MRIILGLCVIVIGLLLSYPAIKSFLPVVKPKLTISQLEEYCVSLETSFRYGYDGGYEDCWSNNEYRLKGDTISPAGIMFGLYLALICIIIFVLGFRLINKASSKNIDQKI